MTEDEAVQIAWDRNVRRVQEAKMTMRAAIQRVSQVEHSVARATGRRRPPSDAELARIAAARAELARARQEHEDAKAHFKAGVTSDQVALVMSGT